MITRIATAAVYVADQAAALRFWTELVGFEEKRRLPMGPAGDWLEVGPAGAESALVLSPRALMDDWAGRKPSLVFACDDVRAAHAALSARGVPFRQAPREMPWGLFAIFEDPEGNWYGLRQS